MTAEKEYTLPELLHCTHMSVDALQKLGEEYERWARCDPLQVTEDLASMLREEYNFDARACEWLQVCTRPLLRRPSVLALSSFFSKLPYSRINHDGTLTVSSEPFVPKNKPWYRRHAR